jgi:thymidylate synthase (FAD)
VRPTDWLPASDTEISVRSDVTVELIDHMGSDASILAAMMVSTKGDESLPFLLADQEQCAGRINYLMKNRHGTPFEHNAMTFYVEAPISVYREHHRHRIGISYNEESGRYKVLSPVFYVPHPDRKLKQIGKPGHYEFVPGDQATYYECADTLANSYFNSYMNYLWLLEQGVAKEVARQQLPVAIYSSMYVTCNARSLMSFLSLRTIREGSMFPSFPMREIEMVAEKYEAFFAELFPVTHNAFRQNGSVAP